MLRKIESSENVRVLVRLRPGFSEPNMQTVFGIKCISDTELVLQVPKQKVKNVYSYDGCFDSSCSQHTLFEKSGIDQILDKVLSGYSSTIFAYGPTGSGKTYTISGIPQDIINYGSGDDSDGLTIRAIESLFEKIEQAECEGAKFLVRASPLFSLALTPLSLVSF